MKYTIKQPELMNGLNNAKYKPNVIISILILLTVYVAYMLASFIASIVYFIIYFAQNPVVLQGSFPDIMQNLMQFATSQDSTLFSFCLEAIFIAFIIIEVRFIEKRPISTLGVAKKRFALHYLIGFGVGALILAAILLPDALFRWTDLSYIGFSPIVALFLVGFIFQSACEEFMFRGYLLPLFGRKIGMFWAVMLSSLLFALLHIINGDMTILSVATIFAIGTFLGFYMVRTNNIWGACGIHAAWNFLQGLVYPVIIGPMTLNYSVISVGDTGFLTQDYGIIGDPAYLISLVIFAAAILWVLFAGKNRIVVRKTDAAQSGIPENTDVIDDTGIQQ